MSVQTIVQNDLLQAKPSLHYVSATARALRLEGEYPADHHVCAFVLVPVPQDGPPTVVIGTVAADREDAIRTLATDLAQPTFSSHPEVAQANGPALGAFQHDVANSAMAKDMLESAQAFNAKVAALAEAGDPVLKALLDGIKAYVGDLLYLCGEKECDPAKLAAIQGFISGYLRSSTDAISVHMRDHSPASIAGFRKDLGDVPTDPNKIN